MVMVTGMCCWLNHWSVVSSLKEICHVVKSPYMVMVMCEIVELNSNSHSDNSRGVKIWLTLPLWGFISSWEGKRVNRSVILSLMWYLLRRSIALWLSFFLLSFTWVLTSFSWYIIPSGTPKSNSSDFLIYKSKDKRSAVSLTPQKVTEYTK